MLDIAGAINYITEWLRDYHVKSGTKGFVVGVSGGIDSALTSTLCARTGVPVLVVEMPIYQAQSQVNRAQEHIAWLKTQYPKVWDLRVELTGTFDSFMQSVPDIQDEHRLNLARANSRARLRMTTLYYLAGIHGLLVAGTGNKVEDFGVGFYTKYGDGGVDLSPIADLNKTEVYAAADLLGIVQSIQKAAPTDGLWGDDRTDEDQIGASYPELEKAMDMFNALPEEARQHWLKSSRDDLAALIDQRTMPGRERDVMHIFMRMHRANRHKMDPIPVCTLPEGLKN